VSKLSEVIAAVVPREWRYDADAGWDEVFGPLVVDSRNDIVIGVESLGDEGEATAAFIGAFSPEHVALMEAALDAAIHDRARTRTFKRGIDPLCDEVTDRFAALQAYRREHGHE
jgi:hypothetical protein